MLTPSTVQIEPTAARAEKRTEYRKSEGRQDTPGCLAEQIARFNHLLPTPCTMETNNAEKVADNARQNLSLKSRKAGHNIQNNLTNFINLEAQRAKMLPTPTQRDHKGTGNVERIRDGQIQKDTLDRIVEPGNTGKLNPAWVEWLMGYPPNWTDIGTKSQKECQECQQE